MTKNQYTIRNLRDDINRFNSEFEEAEIRIKLMIDSHYGEYRIIEVDISGEQQIIKGERCRGKTRECYEELVVWKNNLIKDVLIEIAREALHKIVGLGGRWNSDSEAAMCSTAAKKALKKMGHPYE